MNPIIPAAAVCCLALGSAAVWLAPKLWGPPESCRAAQVAGGDIGGPFTLVNPDGAQVSEAQVLRDPALVYFGYTFCPDICPLDNARNAEAVDLLEAQGFEVTPVFITVDPARDTPEVMGDYAANMHERMIALTGTPEQIDVASKAYKTYYKRHPAEDAFYLVDHSTFSYLMLPGRGFATFFRRDETPEAVAQKAACFLG